MREKDYLKKSYKTFVEFLSVVCSRELEYLILDSSFTSAFNYRIKKMIDQVKKEGKDGIEFSVLFNTQGEVALIDANIIGSFISNNYCASIEKYYKEANLNKIVKEIINGNEKSQKDFIMISYNIIYKTLDELYKEIKYKKDVMDNYVKEYKLENHKNPDLPIVVGVLLILEDVCKYLSIDVILLQNSIDKIISSKKAWGFSTNM